MKKRLTNWFKDPILVPRWLITLKYLAFAILGALSVIGGIPTLALATFESFTTYWSAGLIVAAVIAAVASLERRWEEAEKWSGLVVFALLASWSVAAIWRAASEGDVDRMAGAFAVLIISGLPGARVLGLMRGAGL